jgi:hypothetical protein
MGREIHALSCTSKASQECREACGGHGYLYGMSKKNE